MVDGILSPWDAAALMPIVEEAGGVFTDWKGTRTAFGGSAVATNQGVAAESRSLLATGRHEERTCLICPDWNTTRTAA